MKNGSHANAVVSDIWSRLQAKKEQSSTAYYHQDADQKTRVQFRLVARPLTDCSCNLHRSSENTKTITWAPAKNAPYLAGSSVTCPCAEQFAKCIPWYTLWWHCNTYHKYGERSAVHKSNESANPRRISLYHELVNDFICVHI